MRITINQCDFLDVTFDNANGCAGDNSDTYRFTLSTPGGQPCRVNDVDVCEFSFCIVGNIELREFFEAINAISNMKCWGK